jgi:hypothetical protein
MEEIFALSLFENFFNPFPNPSFVKSAREIMPIKVFQVLS